VVVVVKGNLWLAEKYQEKAAAAWGKGDRGVE